MEDEEICYICAKSMILFNICRCDECERTICNRCRDEDFNDGETCLKCIKDHYKELYLSAKQSYLMRKE